jgi:hypothetical protein
MAEVWARINGARQPSVDVKFNDDWTNPAVRAKDASFEWKFGAWPPRQAADGTGMPTSSGCTTTWNSSCRITVHYLRHIQPIWNADRPIMGGGSNRCINCHAPADINGVVQAPAASLELTTDQDVNFADFAKSYAQLFRARDQFELVNGQIQPIVDDVAARVAASTINPNNGQPECNTGVLNPNDNTQCLICDAGVQDTVNPAICHVTRTTAAPLFANNARGSTRFFSVFRAGGSHAGRLSDAELKLIAEWVDIGAQYYNDPFVAPE